MVAELLPEGSAIFQDDNTPSHAMQRNRLLIDTENDKVKLNITSAHHSLQISILLNGYGIF